MSVLLPHGRQKFNTATGAPGVGYRLHTYIPGTSTPKATFRTYAGTTANTNPVIADSRGEMEIYWSGDYDVVLRDANGVLIWGPARLNEPEVSGLSATLRSDIASSSGTTKGAGQVGFAANLTYPNSTVGAHCADVVSVVDYPFLARGNGTTDDTSAIQAAINWAAQSFDADWFSSTLYATPRVVELSHTHKILGKLIIPRGVIVRGKNTTLIGSGYTTGDNICFETGYYSTGNITTNIGTTPESHRVQYSIIEGIRFINFKVACNLFNFNEGCVIRDCSFYQVGQAIVALRCFYGQFYNLTNRGSAGSSALPCFEFSTFVNVEKIDSITCVDRVLAFQFAGGVNGATITNCSAETGTNGIKFYGEVNPVNIDNCYFETLSGIAIDFTDANAHRAVTIDNNWFQNCATGISGVQMLNGTVGPGNYFLTVTDPVIISDTVSTITVNVPASRYSSGYPTATSGYTLGAAVNIRNSQQVFDAGSGASTAKQNYTGGLVDLPFSGKQATTTTNLVPFCVHSKTAGTTFDVVVDTKIVYDVHTMYVFSLSIVDNVSTYPIRGRGYGDTNFLDTASTKTCVASSNGGFLRLVFSSFSHPSSSYTCTGVVRMM
jgi:hypothetical protein